MYWRYMKGIIFINTHFVYGNEKDAVELLSFIDECLSDKLTLPEKVFKKVLEQYNTNEIYKNVNYWLQIIMQRKDY